MSLARKHRFHHVATTWIRRYGTFLQLSELVFAPLMDILRRPAVSQAFLMSAFVKLSNWDNALYLAAHEYPVSWMDPVLAAYVGVTIELVGAFLLSFGLMARPAAFALLLLTLVAQYSYQPTNIQVFWIILLAYWCIMGAGIKSFDYLLRWLKYSALPQAGRIGSLFDWLTRAVGPYYLLFVRVWIASVLYAAGHEAMESMPLSGWLHLLAYQPHLSVLRGAGDGLWLELICGAGALCLAVGLAARFWAMLSLIVLGVYTHAASASSAQQEEYLYWIMLLTVLFFSGPGRISIDGLIRRVVGELFPQLNGRFPNVTEDMPHVVIVGAGFGGIAAARTLRTTACRITLIDRHNYHLFQPLLYQVATAGLSPSDIATPIRSLFRDQDNIRIMLGEVTGVDKAARSVTLADGTGVAFDYLIVATGARHSYFGKDEWAAFAPGMKRVEDAISVRARLLKAFEEAENTDDPKLRAELLNFIIVGGGPTGVELAGALAELAHKGMENEFRRIDPAMTKIHLVEAGPRLLAVMPETISAYTRASLEHLGVTVHTGGKVEAIDAQGVIINGQRLASRNVIWAAGVQASPAARWLDVPADRAGRVIVNPDLTVPGWEGVYAVGDTVMAEVWNGKPMPGLAPAAKQSGRFAALHLRACIEGDTPPAAFAYRHYGSLATIGRQSAVADFGRFRLTGALAWWFWGVVHIAFLANLQSRFAVMIEWFWAYLTFRRSTRLITEVAVQP